jgi:hypothetical protein
MRKKIAMITGALATTLLMAAGCGDPELGGGEAPLSQLKPSGAAHRYGHHQHHERMLKDAIEQLNLRPDQKATVDRLHNEVKARFVPVRLAAAQVILELGTTAQTARLDRAKLAVLANRVEARMLEVQPAVINALNTLHKTLDAGQRARLVQIIKDHHRKRRAWHKRRHHHARRMIRELGKTLGLSEEQQDQLRAVIRTQMAGHRAERRARRLERRKKIKAAMVAFESDKFDAAQLGLFQLKRGLAARKVQHLLKLADQVLPVLNTEQRGKLAGELKSRARQMEQTPAPAEK